MRYILLCFLLALAISNGQSPPVWPNEFTVDFNETAKMFVSGKTTGTWYYDAANNRQVIQRKNGRHDRYCNSVFELQNTPCRHIVVANKRFLDFPEKHYCCFCCDSAPGCGIVKPDWLIKAGAKYVGEETLDAAGPYQKWEVRGIQQNFYYNKKDEARTPRKLVDIPDDETDYYNFKQGKVDDSHFLLPDYCLGKCGLGTFCAGLRGEKAELTQEAFQ